MLSRQNAQDFVSDPVFRKALYWFLNVLAGKVLRLAALAHVRLTRRYKGNAFSVGMF
jgi:hypothetical protein